MSTLQNILILLAAFSLSGTYADSDHYFPALRAFLNIFGADVADQNKIKNLTPEELGRSRGQSHHIDYFSYIDAVLCRPDDKYIFLSDSDASRRPPIILKCVEAEANPNNYIEDMTSVKDIMELLKPIGNSTKRTDPGSCVFIIFYSWSSLSCIHTVPLTNILPKLYPTLRFAAVDAYKFSSFNTDFGIVGLPTLLLFHQGRPVVKLMDSANLESFVSRHTGINPIKKELVGTIDENHRLKPINVPSEHTFVLALAWIFIFVCLGYYMSKTRWSKQIIEMIKRNWRESEAQMERN